MKNKKIGPEWTPLAKADSGMDESSRILINKREGSLYHTTKNPQN